MGLLELLVVILLILWLAGSTVVHVGNLIHLLLVVVLVLVILRLSGRRF